MINLYINKVESLEKIYKKIFYEGYRLGFKEGKEKGRIKGLNEFKKYTTKSKKIKKEKESFYDALKS